MTMKQARTQARTAARAKVLPDWRPLLLVSFVILAASAFAARAQDEIIKSHGYSYFGELSYPADYTHFNYVNPEAPKGGEISIAVAGTFDSMNPYTRKGRAAALATVGYESLLGSVLAGSGALPADVDGEYYGLLAHTIEYPKDKSWVTFHMRPEAKFSDGTPVTAHDIAFSHNLLLDQGLKSYADAVRKRIPKVEVIDDHTIKFYFADGISRRSLIDQVGFVPAWSKKWYEESGARLDESRLEVSPGSGPYVIDAVDVNRSVTYKRNPDYWGADLPINKGRHNFDTIRIEYFADATAAFEAFKAGEVTYRSESDPKRWATSYDFPAVSSGYVKLEEIPDGMPPANTGIIMNLSREVLSDKRVRDAVALGFNFEWTNASLLYGLQSQQHSFSTGTKYEAKGVPEAAELALLQGLAAQPDADVLSTEPRVPHSSQKERLNDRRNLRKAMKLLDEAGWAVGSDGKRRNAGGDLLTLNFLFNSSDTPTNKALAENFVSNLQVMGVDAKFESVDPSQYTLRERDHDYDLVLDGYPALFGVGTGLQQRFGSEAAALLFNPASLASPVVDEIIEKALLSETQEEEDMMLSALDRVLRHEFFLIPTGYVADHWVAYWDQYGRPETIPPFALGTLDFWWFDAEKAANLKEQGALR
ncbi:extracellular solute-binding protein [Lentibacter sp. XHP0401]|uniref:extracellular solute-binding protein n=1 Tax=Lentibacter sp. XHP0401 TaxID=2984334 RepID=UPI0021E8CB98|nr:extracellular solute-binding protein [Lentibacter sp. XHP0401]MCV2893807.1 extracellular solute-binding protein [Lentibacter sp. XHP0401]